MKFERVNNKIIITIEPSDCHGISLDITTDILMQGMMVASHYINSDLGARLLDASPTALKEELKKSYNDLKEKWEIIENNNLEGDNNANERS